MAHLEKGIYSEGKKSNSEHPRWKDVDIVTPAFKPGHLEVFYNTDLRRIQQSLAVQRVDKKGGGVMDTNRAKKFAM